ncbi:MAG: agmatinase [SAR202 cluster bacterium]|nr:agmatinase [SAR202 cluster bacterium]MDP6713342.1 agmatinase [SAR202 cluster bacterium]
MSSHQHNRDQASQNESLQTWPDIRARPRTFFNTPLCDDLSTLNSDIAFVGMPFDQGTFGRPGARYGPDGVRDARSYTYFSQQDGQEAVGYFSSDVGAELLKNVTMADCGNITVVPSDVNQNFKKLTDVVEKIAERGAFPVVVGGDHAITFPVVRGLGIFDPVDIVHFDAHMDYSHETQGVLYTHGSPIRRCHELPFVRNISSIGIRKESRKVYDEAIADGNLIVTTGRFKTLGAQAAMDLVPPSENLYVTLDIDVLDPVHAPGTGTPETGGLYYEEMRESLICLARNHKIVGFDIVEVAPPYDQSEITTMVAAKLIIDFLGEIFPSKDAGNH